MLYKGYRLRGCGVICNVRAIVPVVKRLLTDHIDHSLLLRVKRFAKQRWFWYSYFYVPKKTKIVGLFADGSGTLLDGSGNVALPFRAKKSDYYEIKVPEGRDGKLYKFHQSNGTKQLMTAPPCLASDA